ncbi:hypothetical protein [Janthinobacterium rivuli]|uniref:hypothetical protein n=1 Tax=Janthinobacterium sp. FT68W TaxID=2654255 RepID=UPI00186AF82D|nr:hypothetical protein [Janthinobacterium sp. FT68W]
MMTALLYVEREWQATDHRKFGIGNISLANGTAYGQHSTHKSGLEVDIRPQRKGGLPVPVYWYDKEYDQAAMAKLIAIFRAHASVRRVLFNDTGIPFVTPFKNHDHHFHLELRA